MACFSQTVFRQWAPCSRAKVGQTPQLSLFSDGCRQRHCGNAAEDERADEEWEARPPGETAGVLVEAANRPEVDDERERIQGDEPYRDPPQSRGPIVFLRAAVCEVEEREGDDHHHERRDPQPQRYSSAAVLADVPALEGEAVEEVADGDHRHPVRILPHGGGGQERANDQGDGEEHERCPYGYEEGVEGSGGWTIIFHTSILVSPG